MQRCPRAQKLDFEAIELEAPALWGLVAAWRGSERVGCEVSFELPFPTLPTECTGHGEARDSRELCGSAGRVM